MLIYLSIILLSSFFAGLANIQKNKNKLSCSIFFFISAFIMFLPLALRGMGVDYQEYVKSYNSTSSDFLHVFDNYIGRPEPLYLILNFFAKSIFANFQGVNILCALFTIAFTFAGLYKFKDVCNLGISVWCIGFLYYILMFGLNRMMISVAISTWAYQYYFSKNTKKYILWTIIATLFHYAAFIMIPTYFLLRTIEKKNITFKSIKWGRIIIAIAAIFTLIYYIIPPIFGNYYWFTRYRSYFILTFNFSSLNNNLGSLLLIILLVIYRKKLSIYLAEKKALLTMIIVFVVLSLACVIMPIHRITYYFYPVCAILYGTIPASKVLSNKTHNKQLVNFLYGFVLLIMGTLWIYQFLVLNNYWAPFLVPYKIGTF